MNFSILNVSTNKFISRSNVRPVGDPSSLNLTIEPLTRTEVVKSRHREKNDSNLTSTRLYDNSEPPAHNEHASPDNSTLTSEQTMLITDPKYLVGGFSSPTRRFSTSAGYNSQRSR